MDTIKKVWGGESGLARTYWGWGVLGSIAWAIAISLVTLGSAAAIGLLIGFLTYYLIVGVGTWRAATAYTGATIWAVLAKLVVGMWTLVLLGGVVMLGMTISGKNMPPPSAQLQPAPAGTEPTTAAPSFEAAEHWTQESTNSANVGPWLQYAPPGTRFCRSADKTIITVYPPGVKPQAAKASPSCVTGSVSSPDQLSAPAATAGNYATCLLDKLPGTTNYATHVAIIQTCTREYPAQLLDVGQGSGRGLFGFADGNACTIKKAKDTPLQASAGMIAVVCRRLYDEPVTFTFEEAQGLPRKP